MRQRPSQLLARVLHLSPFPSHWSGLSRGEDALHLDLDLVQRLQQTVAGEGAGLQGAVRPAGKEGSVGGAAPGAWGAQAAERMGGICETRNVPDSVLLISIMAFHGTCAWKVEMVAGTSFLPSPSCVPQGTRFTQSVAGQSSWRQPCPMGRLRPEEGHRSSPHSSLGGPRAWRFLVT